MHLTSRLYPFLFTPADKAPRSRVWFWFSLSLTVAALIGVMALRQAFAGDYVVQDDARQHVFWLERFSTPGLFPNDLIADYFQAAGPPGYTLFYRSMASLGIHPLFLAKLLPPLLGLVATGYCFGVTLQLLPIPMTGFIATMLLNLNLWMKDDLASATPRAFLYPIFFAFLYYLLKRSLLPCLVAVALAGLFYPTLAFTAAAILLLQLVKVEAARIRLSRDRQDYLFAGAGLAIIFLTLLPFALGKSKVFGSVIKASEARQMPEFQPGGRSTFFNNNPLIYWLTGRRSSIRLPLMFLPELLYVGLSLPFLLRVPDRFPLLKQVTSKLILLPQILVASLGLFFAAHAVLFKIHFPDRYAQHGLRIVMVLATAIALTVLLDSLFQRVLDSREGVLGSRDRRALLPVGVTALVAAFLFFYPVYLRVIGYPFPTTNYQIGTQPTLYQFFAQQPLDTRIASLAGEANNLPSFSQRAILVGGEYAIPLHKGYYAEIRQRSTALLQAQYSPRLSDAQQFLRTYPVNFWLLDKAAFDPNYLLNDPWLMQYRPLTTDLATALQQGTVPAIKSLIPTCTAFETEKYTVLKTDCIANASPKA